MEILNQYWYVILGAIILLIAAYIRKQEEDEKSSQPIKKPTPVIPPTPIVTSSVSGLPISNVWWLDDFALSSTKNIGGDPNSHNDGAFAFALQEHYGKRLAGIGATCVGKNKGRSPESIQGLRNAAGYEDLPIYLGSPTYAPKSSDISRKLVEASRKGKITICVTGPPNDLVQALREGLVKSNVTKVILIGINTWNDFTDPITRTQTRANMNELYRSGLPLLEVSNWTKFLKAPKGVQWNEDWIKKWRSRSKLIQVGFSDFINNEIEF